MNPESHFSLAPKKASRLLPISPSQLIQENKSFGNHFFYSNFSQILDEKSFSPMLIILPLKNHQILQVTESIRFFILLQ
jgi:hypothetical protein